MHRRKVKTMVKALCKADKPVFYNIFPSWTGRQPARFFMMENLLEARLASVWPTNGGGPDEDVNVFLAGLLTRFLNGDHETGVVAGADCLLFPPAASLSRRLQAQYYLANANHRLLFLGLFNRGDGLRRRRTPFGWDDHSARRRDFGVGQACYAMAVNLLEDRRLVGEGLVEVLNKLAENFEEYVQVLSVLATQRLGLGASLSERELSALLTDPVSGPTAACPDLDQLLDIMLDYREQPGPELEELLRATARHLGVDEEKILGSGPSIPLD